VEVATIDNQSFVRSLSMPHQLCDHDDDDDVATLSLCFNGEQELEIEEQHHQSNFDVICFHLLLF
jgi:hypothetical protein